MLFISAFDVAALVSWHVGKSVWTCSSVRYEWRNTCTVTNSCVLQLHRQLHQILCVCMLKCIWVNERGGGSPEFMIFITVKRAVSAWQSSKVGRNSSNADFVDIQLTALLKLWVSTCVQPPLSTYGGSVKTCFFENKNPDVFGMLENSKPMCFNNHLCLTDFSKI